MPAGSSQDLLIRTCTRAWKDLLEDANRIFITSALKDLCKTFVKSFTYFGPLRLHRETFARSPEKDLPENL